jgi:hypothetical protein
MKKKTGSALSFFSPRVLTAHRKQTGTRPFRMPALLGMLHCAAGLIAISGKAFFQGQGMNRPLGIIRLRPLVGFLSTVIAAILLYASDQADAQAPPGIGIMYLTRSDQAGDPFHDLSNDPEWTNPAVQGVSLRTQWARVEPHEHANTNDFYWGYLDQGVALAAAHGKKVSILVTAGVSCPQWLFDAGAAAFYVTTEYGYSSVTDGVTTAGSTTVRSAGETAGWDPSVSVGLQISGGSIPAGATIVAVNSRSNVTISAPATQSATGVVITTAQILPMPLPWDPIFQQKWGAFIQAFAARYGSAPNLAYVVMGGPGRREESYFCFTAEDIDYFTNTLGGLPNWEQGVKWIIDQYGTYFPNTPFILAMAAPIPLPDGRDSIKAVVDYGAAQHPGNHFGVMSCGLQYPGGPDNGSLGATEVPLLSPTSTVGYQFFRTQHEDVDPVTGRFMLDLGLERGINFGAHFIEVYGGDCDDPVLAPVLTAAGARMRTTGHPGYVLRNASTLRTAIWYLDNNLYVSGAFGPTLPVNWSLVGVADFDRDGHEDYMLFNSSNHQTAIWYLSGPTRIGGAYGPTLPSGWVLVATADFNNDGHPDYLLYNPASRQTAIWYLYNNVHVSGAFGPTLPVNWSVAGVADFDRDGHEDYMLFNSSNHQTAIWYLSGPTGIGGAYGPTLPGGWELKETADFNGDGFPDYLLYNAVSRQTAIWYLNNNVYLSAAFGPTLPVGWSLIGQ